MEETSQLQYQTGQPESLVNPSVKPSSSNKPLLIVLFIVLLVGLSSLITYLFVKSQTPSQIPEITPTPLAQATPSPDPTANWKVYTNKLYNFIFKYPVDFVLTDTLPETQLDRALDPSEKVELKNTKENLTLSIYLDQAGFGPIFADKTLKVDYQANRGIYIISSEENDIKEYLETNTPKEYQINTIPFVPTKNFGLSFIYNFPRNESTKEKLFDQILSTFKFN